MRIKQYIQHPISFTLIICAFIGLGLFSILGLPVKMYPNMAKPSFQIWYGHEHVVLPLEIYKTYGKNLEEQIKELKGLESYNTTYSKKRARLTLEFEWNTNSGDLEEKIKNILIGLKSGDRKFWYQVQNKAEQSSGGMMLAIGHQFLSNEQLQDFLDNNLTPKIKNIDGVERVSFWGERKKQLSFELDQDKLLAHNINITSLIDSIQQAITTTLAGKVGLSGGMERSYAILFPAKAQNAQEILNIIVKQDTLLGLTIRLKELGKIEELEASANSIYRLNGNNANFLSIGLVQKGDIKKTCDQVSHILKNFKNGHAGFNYNILVNPASFIQNAINNLLLNACIGGLIAIAVIYLFLGTFRNTLIIGLSIPFCIVTSFVMMSIFGVSINIISLGGMAIGVGMILDSSIVTLENIYRNLAKKRAKEAFLSPQTKVNIVIESTKEVALPIISSILTSIVVFFPIIYTKSYTQAILGDLAKTVIFSLGISTFASLIIVPVASYHCMDFRKRQKSTQKKFLDIFISYYLNLLQKILSSKKRCLVTIGLCSLFFISSLFLAPKIKKEIMAVPGTKLFDIKFRLQDNHNLSLTQKYVNRVENFLKKRKEIKNYATYLWRPSNGFITAELESRNQFDLLKKDFEKKFPPTPEAKLTAMKWDPGQMPLPKKNDMLLSVSGGTATEMARFSDKVMKLSHTFDTNMSRDPWISKEEDIKISFLPHVEKDQFSEIQNYISVSSMNGLYVTEIIENGKNRPLNFILQKEQRSLYINDLKNLPVSYKEKIIPLKALANISIDTSEYIPKRKADGKDQQVIYINFNEKNEKKKKSLMKKLEKAIAHTKRPQGLTTQLLDPNKEINKSFRSFKLALFVSIFLVFTIITILFNSLKYPFIILATIPFAITGVLVGLYICNSTISLNSMLGTILLSGLVVNNAILFIDFYITARKKGRDDLQCILEAAKLRFRPIIMTTLTTLFGVVPVALAIGESGEILRPLGVAIFFGLLVSTLVALIITPCFLKLSQKKKINP